MPVVGWPPASLPAVVLYRPSIFYPHRLAAFLSSSIPRMATPDRIRTHQVTESLPPSVVPIQAGETHHLSRMRRDAPSLRNAPPSHPRTPSLVSKNAKSATPTFDSQFQAHARH